MISLSTYPYDAMGTTSNYGPFLADIIMSEDKNDDKKDKNGQNESGKKMGMDFGSSMTAGPKRLFANPDMFDIYCDCDADQNYIFHDGDLNCTVDHLEYDPETQRITVYTNDGQKLDLGARIQWLVRPYIAKNQDIYIVRTENGKTIDGIQVPLIVKVQEQLKPTEHN
tara:strand:- start:987 stop:1490 length:504 start_codon:yes stop_codon:yes gene_type:complete